MSEPRRVDKKQIGIQEIVESLKGAADDIGQISELTSEERNLVAEFFKSMLKLMKPLAASITVATSCIAAGSGNLVQAQIDPTGHLAMFYLDGHLELRNLVEETNRDLMIEVIQDVLPKFKNLTSLHKRKIENRIKLLSTVTKEVQKASDALSATAGSSQ